MALVHQNDYPCTQWYSFPQEFPGCPKGVANTSRALGSKLGSVVYVPARALRVIKPSDAEQRVSDLLNFGISNLGKLPDFWWRSLADRVTKYLKKDADATHLVWRYGEVSKKIGKDGLADFDNLRRGVEWLFGSSWECLADLSCVRVLGQNR